jgi:hypothetical protein
LSMTPIGLENAPPPMIPPANRMPAIIPLRFWTEYKHVPGQTAPVEEDRVEWVKKGEGNGGAVTSEAIKRLAPTATRAGAIEWAVIGPAYEAWKKGNATPLSGTPLHAWSGVSREMADALKKVNIFTIEDLADFPDHQMAKIPIPQLREWRNRAKAWREAQSANDVGDKLAARDRKIEEQNGLIGDLQEQMREMQQALAEMKAGATNAAKALKPVADDEDMPTANAGEKLVPASAPPPRRGRPPRE